MNLRRIFIHLVLPAIYWVLEYWLHIRHGTGLWGREGSKCKKLICVDFVFYWRTL